MTICTNKKTNTNRNQSGSSCTWQFHLEPVNTSPTQTYTLGIFNFTTQVCKIRTFNFKLFQNLNQGLKLNPDPSEE